MKKGKARLLHFGLGVSTLHYSAGKEGEDGLRYRHCIIGDYKSPGNWSGLAEEYQGLDFTDVVVLDVRDAVGSNPALAFEAPMVDVDLADDEVLSAPNLNSPLARLLDDVDPTFHTVVTLERMAKLIDKNPSPLSTVGRGVFVAWWQVRGARVGHLDETRQIIWRR